MDPFLQIFANYMIYMNFFLCVELTHTRIDAHTHTHVTATQSLCKFNDATAAFCVQSASPRPPACPPGFLSAYVLESHWLFSAVANSFHTFSIQDIHQASGTRHWAFRPASRLARSAPAQSRECWITADLPPTGDLKRPKLNSMYRELEIRLDLGKMDGQCNTLWGSRPRFWLIDNDWSIAMI